MTKYKNKYRIESTRLRNWNYGDAALYFVTICTKNRVHYFGEIENGIMKPSVLGEIVISEWIKTFEIRHDMNLSMGEFVVMPNHFHAIIGIGENEYNNGNDTDDVMDTDDGMDMDDGMGTDDGMDTGGGMDADGDMDADGGRGAMHRTSTRGVSMRGVSTDRISTRGVSMCGVSMRGVSTDRISTRDVSTDRISMRGVSTNHGVSTFGPQSKNLASIMRGFKSSVTVFARKNNIDFQWQSLYHDHIIRNEKSFINISNYIINNPLNWKEDNFFKSE